MIRLCRITMQPYFFNFKTNYKMFNSKKTTLFETTSNPFVNAALKEQSVRTNNGGVAYTTSGDPFVDQFGSSSEYLTQRDFSLISKDCEILWNCDKEKAVKFMFFIRMITRKVTYTLEGSQVTTKEPQKGAELRYESIMRYIWLSINHASIFWKNAWLIPFVGSWKDIFLMLRYDLIYNGWDNRVLDWTRFGELILSGLENTNTSSLVKKYLPQVRAKSKCKTIEAQANCLIGKWISSLIFGRTNNLSHADKYVIYRKYAKLKASGTAHEWQQLISKCQYNRIDFNSIHAKALGILARSNFFDKYGLREAFTKWITNDNTKVKATEFVHEIFSAFPDVAFYSTPSKVSDDTAALINKKFNTLVEKGKSSENFCKFIVARDTSSSMTARVNGTTSSCYDIAKALALYFSEFLTGPFAGTFLEFANTCRIRQWIGKTPLDKWLNDDCEAYGSTNFYSIIELFADTKTNQKVSEEYFPKGILCISDGEFDPNMYNTSSINAAKAKLKEAGFSQEYIDSFVMVFWNITNTYYSKTPKTKFQSTNNIPNVYYFSGFSGSIISFINGEQGCTAKDIFDSAMNQEILNLIKL